MEKTEKLTLIAGEFLHDDATDFLVDIFSSRINFYKIKNLGSHVRYGGDDEMAQKSMATLKAEMEKLHLVLCEARAQNKKLVISSEVNISLVDNE